MPIPMPPGAIFANLHHRYMSKLGISLAGGNFAGSWQYLAPILLRSWV